jgi:hypothetical protein
LSFPTGIDFSAASLASRRLRSFSVFARARSLSDSICARATLVVRSALFSRVSASPRPFFDFVNLVLLRVIVCFDRLGLAPYPLRRADYNMKAGAAERLYKFCKAAPGYRVGAAGKAKP